MYCLTPDVTTATVKLSYKLTPYGTVFSSYSMDLTGTRGILCICPGPAVRSLGVQSTRGGEGFVWLLSALANSTKFGYRGQPHIWNIYQQLDKKMKNKWKSFFMVFQIFKDCFIHFTWEFHLMCPQSIMVLFTGSLCLTSEAFSSKHINNVKNLRWPLGDGLTQFLLCEESKRPSYVLMIAEKYTGQFEIYTSRPAMNPVD